MDGWVDRWMGELIGRWVVGRWMGGLIDGWVG